VRGERNLARWQRADTTGFEAERLDAARADLRTYRVEQDGDWYFVVSTRGKGAAAGVLSLNLTLRTYSRLSEYAAGASCGAFASRRHPALFHRCMSASLCLFVCLLYCLSVSLSSSALPLFASADKVLKIWKQARAASSSRTPRATRASRCLHGAAALPSGGPSPLPTCHRTCLG
jgi:hypothetical protein